MKEEIKHYIEEQLSVCKKYRTEYVESPNNLKLGISKNVKSGISPINGLRVPLEGDTISNNYTY